MALLLAINQWRSYLQLAEFTIFTDHKSLTQLNEQRLHTYWQQKVYSKLIGLQYKIVYKKGSKNSAADALSCRSHESSQVLAISVEKAPWMEEIMLGYQQDEQALDLLTKLAISPSAKEHFSLQHGIIRHKGKIWLGNNTKLQQRIILVFRESAIGGIQVY